MRHGIVMATLIVLIFSASSSFSFASASSSRPFRTSRSSRGTVMGQLKAPVISRRANEAEAPRVYAGALIRTAGAGWKVSAGSPQQHHFVESGGFIAGGSGGHYLSLHPGIQAGPSDRLPSPAPGTTASGRNAITPNDNTGLAEADDSSGPPFPGGASGNTPPNK
jgi:hypothetical protein